MAIVYIIYSPSIDQYYIGSCLNFESRLDEHQNNTFEIGFTHRANDWKLYYSRDNLNYQVARKIEAHIKKMKSRKYIENLRLFPEIMNKLILKYDAGSSR